MFFCGVAQIVANGRPFAKVLVEMTDQNAKRDTLWVSLFAFWWAIKGSNLGPTGYEPVALTN